MDISADAPELIAFAQLAGVEPWRMALAFNDPDRLLDHLALEEIARFKSGCDALEALRIRMLLALQQYMAFTRGVLAGAGAETTEPEAS